MTFCPKCGSILIPKGEGKKQKIVCSRCSYIEKGKKKSNMTIKDISIINKTKLEVIDKDVETDPKTEIECPKCGHNLAYYWLAQTRAADEAETMFFKCIKCKHKWRSYE